MGSQSPTSKSDEKELGYEAEMNFRAAHFDASAVPCLKPSRPAADPPEAGLDDRQFRWL